ncbi:MAG: PAS domain S-box protein, partial [Balneolaceae bacterium]
MLTKRTFQEIFSSLHTPCLVFLPDSPRFTIVEVNEAFTNAVKVQRSELINRGLFKAFQDSENPEWTGHDLLASIKYVLKEKEPHDMDMQKFYVSANNGNGSELKYWNPVNSPVFNEDGEISVIVHSVSDVTDMVRLKESEAREKATEQTLEETNNRLSTILASITDGFFAVDSSWIVTYWNTEAEKLLKIKSEEILGRDLWKVFSPHTDQSLMKFYQEYKNVMDNRKPASFRGYYEEMDVWFKVNVYPGKDGLSVFFTDITRQKKVERERGQALQRLHERGKEQACLYRITNLKEQDYTVPELLLEVVHYIPGGWRSPEFTSAKIDFNGQSFETDHFEPSDWTITSVNRTRNGPLRISVSYTNELPGIEENPVRDEDIRLLDSITHNLCLKIDQILGQQELEENRAELQKIMDQSMDVICTIDHQSRFVKVGAVSEKVWGYHPAELVGSSYLDLVYGDDISQTIQSVNSLLSGSKVITFENRCIRKDGAVRSMEWSARNDHENEIMYCVARDVQCQKMAGHHSI